MSLFAKNFLDQSRTYLKGEYMPRIEKAVSLMSEEDFWWRPNQVSNSAGNIVLHLAGNVRQWIVHGLAGAKDVRIREEEFSARGGITKEQALAKLRASVDDACAVLADMNAEALAASYTPQNHNVTGLKAVYHVVEHFAMHTGQIVWIAKMRSAQDLGFYAEAPGGRAKLTWVPTPDGPAT